MDVTNIIKVVLSNYAPLISLFGAIVGSLIGVIASQILSLYRSDLDTERELDGVLKSMDLATADDLSGKKRTEKIRNLEGELRDLYKNKSYLIGEEGLDQIMKSLIKIQMEHQCKPNDNDAYVILPDGEEKSVTSEVKKCKEDIEDSRRNVRLTKSCKRYFGQDDPYE